MTAKTNAEKEKKQSQNQQSLKGTLAEVLEKSKPQVVSSEQGIQKPAAPEAPRREEEKKPFEVSEDTLRKVLKGES